MRDKISWPIVLWLVVIHAGALAAPFYFTWSAVACSCLLWCITGCFGVTLGYHRLFTHASFATYKTVRYLLALFGTLAGQGGVIQWVADHRRHHQFADMNGDPHSPREGFWWAHQIWNFYNGPSRAAYYDRYCPDLVSDKGMVVLNRFHVVAHFALAGLLYAIGGWPFIFWGMFVRLAFGLHATWAVNSAGHMWGYRNFNTRDDSKNNAWVALFTFGEGWHNNHHAFPRSARHGFELDEPDPTWWIIQTMSAFGLAWHIVTPCGPARVNYDE